jgi:5'-nucleotidase
MVGSSSGGVSSSGGTGLSVQLLQLSDWHCQVDRTSLRIGAADVPVGGADVLKAYFTADRAANPNTILVTGGDEFGASPPLCSRFEERPAVEILNSLGLRVNTFGNHNWDRGNTHLQDMINLATYEYVSANLDGLTGQLSGVITPFHIETIGGVQVAFVGITNVDAPSLVFPGRMGTITVKNMADSAAAAMAARQAAETAGATVFVALVHMGATGATAGVPVGPLLDFANLVTGFDVILGDHTNIEVNTTINGQLVSEAYSAGKSYGRIQLDLNPTTRRVVAKSAVLVPTIAANVTPDTTVEAVLGTYRTQLRADFDVVVGQVSGTFTRDGTAERRTEVAIGDLVADSMYYNYPSAEFAIINGGGIRAPIPSSYVPANTGLVRTGCSVATPCTVVRGDIYSVLPFGNGIALRTVTGAKVWEILEHAVDTAPQRAGHFLQVSGLFYQYDVARPVYSPTVPGSGRIINAWKIIYVDDGMGGFTQALEPIPNDLTRTYVMATSDFINAGGDGYGMLAGACLAPDCEIQPELMAEVLEGWVDYLSMNFGAVAPFTENRVAPTAQLVINEVAPDITVANGGDLMELKVVNGGSLQGVTLWEGIQGGVRLGSLTTATESSASAMAATGDLVVVHFNNTATVTERLAKDACTEVAPACFPGALDIALTPTAALVHSDRVLLARGPTRPGETAPSGPIQDAVSVFHQTLNLATWDNDLQTVQGVTQWTPANCGGAPCVSGGAAPNAESVSVDWTTVGTLSTGTTVQRRTAVGMTPAVAVDTHAAGDWTLAPGTLGADNPN